MLETTLGSPVLASEVIFVAIGWNDAISVVTTVTDTTGDTFTPAQAVQRGGAMSQQVYLALTPQGGANKIAVVFSQAVPNPSVRVCIYAGVKQTDLPATVGAGGNGTFAVSGTVTTVVPNELVIASVVGTSNAGLDLAFVTAINTTPLGHVVEEHVAPMPRNMQASASFGPTSDWVIVLSSLQPF
jgi:hypothetical protein